MTALLIIGIVLCGLAILFNLVNLVVSGDDANVLAWLNCIPLTFAIIAMSIAL